MTWLKRLLTTLALLSCAAVAAFFLLGPRWVDSASNQVVGDPGRRPTPEALARRDLHQLVCPSPVSGRARETSCATERTPDTHRDAHRLE